MKPVVDQITVEAGGKTYSGWESVSVSRALDQLAGSFELKTVIDRPLAIRAGDPVVVRIGADLVASGFVDEMRLVQTDDESGMTIAGRDRTQDLVDCSVPINLDSLTNVSLAEILTKLCEPYSVTFKDRRPLQIHAGTFATHTIVEEFAKFRFNAGEPCAVAIQRACREKGALAFTDEQGRLIIELPGARNADAAIVQGQANLELHWSQSDRFQTYYVLGQRPGSDNGWGKQVAEVIGLTADGGVARGRTLVIVAESAVDTSSAEAIARWEATLRAARSAGIAVERRDWRQTTSGRLWSLNELVPVRWPRIQFQEQMLVNEIEFSYGEKGRRTRLDLVRPDSYAKDPKLDRADDPMHAWASGRSDGEDAALDEINALDEIEPGDVDGNL